MSIDLLHTWRVFSLLASNIENRVTFKSDNDSLDFPSLNLAEILENYTQDTFNNLVQTFLSKNAISGVQPKSLALIRDKESLYLKEYIVKTWGDEFAYLSENEYICLKAVQKAGVEIPEIYLSKNKKFLVVKKFIYKDDNTLWGFEEILSLQDKNRDKKYSGSYEQVAKVIYGFVSNKRESMSAFYKTIVMSYLLKNGDAYLKNFGLLFSDDFSEIKFSPTYDIVTTTAYIFKDKPALTLSGKKVWWGRDELVKFGQTSCMLSKKESIGAYDECLKALKSSISDLETYIKKNSAFSKVGKIMLDSWSLGISGETIKEVDDELIRSWKNY